MGLQAADCTAAMSGMKGGAVDKQRRGAIHQKIKHVRVGLQAADCCRLLQTA